MQDRITVMVKVSKMEKTGSIGKNPVYNFFFTKVKDSWLEPIILSNIDSKVINIMYNKYINNYKNQVENIVIVPNTNRQEKTVEEYLKHIFEYLLLEHLNPLGQAIENFINKNPVKDFKFTRTQAVSYLLNGIIYIKGHLIYKWTYKGKYKSLTEFLESDEIKSPTPVTTPDGIYIYYPGERKLVLVSPIQ